MSRRCVYHLLLASALLLACASSPSSTAGQRVSLRTVVRAEPGVAAELPAASGFHVTLARATLAFDALYYFDGAPAFATLRSPRRAPWPSWGRILIGVAHAHPQHYVPGNALGQMTRPSAVDLLAGPAALADGEGVTGTYRSARLSFPRNAAVLAEVEGVARQGEQVVHFRLAASSADIRERSPAAEVDGSVFDEVAVEQDGTVTMTVSPSVWFRLVDFSSVQPGTAESPTVIAPGDKAHTAFVLGVAQLSAYRYHYFPGEDADPRDIP